MKLCEYECPHHGRFEVLEDREEAIARDCPQCAHESPFCYPGPSIGTKYAYADTTAKSERPAGFLSTADIADRKMTVGQFKAERARRRKERIRNYVRSKLGE